MNSHLTQEIMAKFYEICLLLLRNLGIVSDIFVTALYRWWRAVGELRAVVMEMVAGALPVLTAAATGAARRRSQGTLRAPGPLWSSLDEHWTDWSLCLSHL